MNTEPIYNNTREYASEHEELASYRASLKANIACKEAIEGAIRKHFDGMHLDASAVKEAVEAFGAERVCYILANTVQQKSWDGRFSVSNKEWAKQFNIPDSDRPDDNSRYRFAVESHPAVLDGFIQAFRREYAVKRNIEQGAEQVKPSLYETMDKARAQVKPKARQQSAPMKHKEPER